MICNKAHALFLQLGKTMVQWATGAGHATRRLLRQNKLGCRGQGCQTSSHAPNEANGSQTPPMDVKP